MKKNYRYFWVLLLTSILVFTSIPFNAAADSKSDEYRALVDTGFESGEFEGWTAFGSKSDVLISNEKAYNGFSCLKSYNRTEAWSGPSLNITDIITPGEEYLFRVYAIADKVEEMEILLTLKYVDDTGAESYNNMVTETVRNDTWTLIESTAVVPDNITDAIFYLESVSGTDDFCIDDISIYGGNKPKNNLVYEENDGLLSFDFEKGTEGWIPRGEVKMEITEDFSYSGKRSLYISDKVENWNAPMVRIASVVPGINYTYSAYVMYIDKQCDDDHNFSIRLQYNLNGEEIYATIKSKLLQNGTWSKISGVYVIPDGATDLYFYIRADDEEENFENIDFYIDDVEIVDSTAAVNLHRRNMILMAVAALAIVFVLFFLLRFFIRKSLETKAALRASSIDSMTGACNRNTYEEYVAELEKNPEKCENLYVMACDVNFLKYINDNYGHDCGDKAIIRCAGVLLRVFGKKGTVYRIGGDEFVCFSTVDLSDAVNVEFARENIDYKGYPFSAAVGVAHYDPQIDLGGADIKALIARSDKAMYEHKIEIKKTVDFID